jgi:hypothetical protein
MSYNVRDDNGTLGQGASVELLNGAGAPTNLKIQIVEYFNIFIPAAANAVNQVVFISPPAPSAATGALPLGQYSLVSASVRFGTASTSGTLQIERTPSGTAVGSGTNLLAGTLALSGTANTVASQFPSASLSAANQILTPGDALSLIFAGTLTNLANAVVTVVVARTV